MDFQDTWGGEAVAGYSVDVEAQSTQVINEPDGFLFRETSLLFENLPPNLMSSVPNTGFSSLEFSNSHIPLPNADSLEPGNLGKSKDFQCSSLQDSESSSNGSCIRLTFDQNGKQLICFCLKCQELDLQPPEKNNPVASQATQDSATTSLEISHLRSTRPLEVRKFTFSGRVQTQSKPHRNTTTTSIPESGATSYTVVKKQSKAASLRHARTLIEKLNAALQSVIDPSSSFKWEASEPMFLLRELIDKESLLVKLDPSKNIYSCTYPKCEFSTSSSVDWKRHEEKESHWPQKRYMCMLCGVSTPLKPSGHCCRFCPHEFDTEKAVYNHSLGCEHAKKLAKTFGRLDKITAHLQSEHSIERSVVLEKAEAWSFKIDSDWPRRCGFCEASHSEWEERATHLINEHFKKGAKMIDWDLFSWSSSSVFEDWELSPQDRFGAFAPIVESSPWTIRCRGGVGVGRLGTASAWYSDSSSASSTQSSGSEDSLSNLFERKLEISRPTHDDERNGGNKEEKRTSDSSDVKEGNMDKGQKHSSQNGSCERCKRRIEQILGVHDKNEDHDIEADEWVRSSRTTERTRSRERRRRKQSREARDLSAKRKTESMQKSHPELANWLRDVLSMVHLGNRLNENPAASPTSLGPEKSKTQRVHESIRACFTEMACSAFFDVDHHLGNQDPMRKYFLLERHYKESFWKIDPWILGFKFSCRFCKTTFTQRVEPNFWLGKQAKIRSSHIAKHIAKQDLEADDIVPNYCLLAFLLDECYSPYLLRRIVGGSFGKYHLERWESDELSYMGEEELQGKIVQRAFSKSLPKEVEKRFSPSLGGVAKDEGVLRWPILRESLP